MKLMGINDLKSEKAAFIVCPQFEECICNCRMGKADNSKYRINEMIKRLETVLNDN